jgi:hypothetical protein
MALEAVDWSGAERIDVEIREGAYWPMIVTLLRHRPYVLEIANADPESRLFNTTGLFQNADLGSVTVAGGPPEYDPVEGVKLPPMATAEIEIRALCTGRYDVRDSWIPHVSLGEGGGVIYVE